MFLEPLQVLASGLDDHRGVCKTPGCLICALKNPCGWDATHRGLALRNKFEGRHGKELLEFMKWIEPAKRPGEGNNVVGLLVKIHNRSLFIRQSNNQTILLIIHSHFRFVFYSKRKRCLTGEELGPTRHPEKTSETGRWLNQRCR